MNFKTIGLSFIATSLVSFPVLAQDSLPSMEQSELNRRVRDTQSLDAQSQYNAYHANNSESETSPLEFAIGIGCFVSAFGLLGIAYKIKDMDF